MRYRALDPNGDYTFGGGQTAFLVNSSAAVAQAVKTRLLLFRGEWFVDLTDGTDWRARILGPRTAGTRDAEIRQRILNTPGVTSIDVYGSAYDPNTRAYSVNAQISTIYGAATVATVVPISPAPPPVSPAPAAQPQVVPPAVYSKVLGTESGAPIVTEAGSDIALE